MAGNRGVGVAVDVGLPFPTRRVGVSCANILGLQALEFLLVAELVGLSNASLAQHCDIREEIN